MTRKGGMEKIAKVFEMNGSDWWADYSLEDAKNNYLKFTGTTSDDNCWSDEPPVEVSEEQMKTLRFNPDPYEQHISLRTFQEELDKRVRENDVPSFFASTEY